MQQGDYTSYYQQQYPHLLNPNPNPNPNPNANLIDPPQNQTAPFASAPPFSTGYDYSPYPPNYPPYPPPHNPDPPRSPTASTYIPTATTPSLQPPFNPPPTSQPSFPPYDHHGPPYQQPQQSITPANPQPFFPPLDQHQTSPAPPPSYAAPAASIPPGPTPTNTPYSSIYTASYNQIGSSVPVPGSYDNLHDNSLKFDQRAGYFEDKYGGGYNWSRSASGSGSGSDPYGKRPESVRNDDVYGDGVYAYEGGKTEPYGARGTAPKSSTWSGFDDFGRPISFPSSGQDTSMGSGLGKIVRAVPKVDAQQDVKDGVQKFRVKLLTESAGQSTMDVLCQIGLDGIRMLDPNTSRTLRIYPLENITRCDKFDSSTFAFWSKSSVDNEPRRIRLQSNSYTTNTLLDTVTAATVQFKEMGGRSRPSNITKTAEPLTEKKKGFVDWMNLIKPGNEEKDHWVPDEAISKCTGCGTDFSAFVRKHHCRNCGDIFCDKCTHGRIALTAEENAQPVRVCDRCLAEVTQRLSNAKEAASKPVGLQSHEDLARKLQEEMEKNRKSSLGTKSDGSGRRMKEVACPTCTVHLQVQVPTSGSETIECGVCQHPFLVSAH